jgi:hypothetical protein
MANGCVEQRITRDEFKAKATDDKLTCLWDVMVVLSEELRQVKRWNWLRMSSQFAGAMIGGGIVVLFAMKYGVKL